MNNSISTLLKKIDLLLLDVDGVLTDGAIIYTGGKLESKYFSVKDGLGIRMLLQAGIRVGIVTGRSSKALTRRCRELGIDNIYDDIRDKGAILTDILTDMGIASANSVAFIGDDLPDLPLLKKVGVAIAVADAHPEVRAGAAIVTMSRGGRGAVREICEAILHARGLWDRTISRYQ